VVKDFDHASAPQPTWPSTKKGPKDGPVSPILIKKIKKLFLIMHNYP
tara:strand:+ start:179 stop:319 length:141 start_codon:yes stop_codon:yes gene_type:complete